MGEGAAGAHRHGDEDRLGDFRVRRPGALGALGVGVDAEGTLRDVRRSDGDDLFCLQVERPVREDFLVEIYKRAEEVGL